jgi:hypothetical protein
VTFKHIHDKDFRRKLTQDVISILAAVSILLGFCTFFAMGGISIWLGVCMIVPQKPFTERNIAGGVCMILFSVFMSIAAGFLVWFTTGGVCVVCCEDDYC